VGCYSPVCFGRGEQLARLFLFRQN